MAAFRQHISLGAILSAAGVAVVFFYGFLTDPLLLIIFFLVGTVGSTLPDVDSDSGLPFLFTFGLATVGVGAAVLYYMLIKAPANQYELIGVPIGALIFFWFVVGGLFKRITHHRGIWHSVPALGIASTSTYVVTTYLSNNAWIALIMAGAMTLGFLSHLVLDEIVSDVNLDGSAFAPKRSLGTALKLVSPSHTVTFFAYALLCGLVYIALH